MERVPVEIWQQILRKVMEMDDAHIFATSCTPYTFVYFVDQQTITHKQQKSHLVYLERRRRLRLVCRAWSKFVLLTSHRWLWIDETSASAVHYLASTTPDAGGVRAVERLSTTIISPGRGTPILSWESHILKRPANQFPLRAYTLRLLNPTQGYNPFDYLVGTGTTPECTSANTNMTLRSLSVTKRIGENVSIALPQISSTFKGLRSLFLINITATPTQTMVLPHLEVLYMYTLSAFSTLQDPMRTWNTPALRHVYLGCFDAAEQLTGVLDSFLGRYARQIESLALIQIDQPYMSIMDLPPCFWSQFSALRLLGLRAATLEHKDWSGWTVTPPATHPLQYLMCWAVSSAEHTVGRVRPRWTWHRGVRLVAGQNVMDTYYVVKDVRDGQWVTKMEETNGILPEL
jgi:hypothetical protein